MKQSDFSCFELTLIISIWLHHFNQESATFSMLPNGYAYVEQISQNNGPFQINLNYFQLYVCLCVFETSDSVSRWLHLFEFQATHNYFALKLHCFNSTAVLRPHWVRYFWQVSIFCLCQLSCTDEKNQINCIAKILISAWRVVGNLLLINVELDKNSQLILFVILINAS